MPQRRVASSALHAGARDRAWISAMFRSRINRTSSPALAQITCGLLDAARMRISSPPASASSCAILPPRVATSAVQPACFSARAMSMVVRSAPPVSSVGTIWRITGAAGSAAQAPLWSSVSVSRPKAMALLASERLIREDGETIAYLRRAGKSPGVVWLGGFHSDMNGTKAQALDAWAESRGRACLRFDYYGHGASSGAFRDGTITRWRDDALAVLDRLCEGPQVLVGSSMGAWIALLAALARPEKVAAQL